YKIGGRHFKKVPRGYDPGHPNAGLLLHNGLYAYYEGALPDDAYSPRFVDYCFNILREISPLQEWLTRVNTI
ncbi:MAG TPA: TIGR02453 family protein, partial [Thermodesulfobacteriota bacterium]|nr:TIGR02453 family protein [Thermodesulfobacteriota bacterium]